jgi:hypothetical protein
MWNFIIIIIFRSTTADPSNKLLSLSSQAQQQRAGRALCVRGFEPVLAGYHILRLIPGYE